MEPDGAGWSHVHVNAPNAAPGPATAMRQSVSTPPGKTVHSSRTVAERGGA